jgi:hypothetical protein
MGESENHERREPERATRPDARTLTPAELLRERIEAMKRQKEQERANGKEV